MRVKGGERRSSLKAKQSTFRCSGASSALPTSSRAASARSVTERIALPRSRRLKYRPSGPTIPRAKRHRGIRARKEPYMAWKKPKVIEVYVGMEINCYACAEL